MDQRLAGGFLGSIPHAAIVFADAPRGIVGRSRDHTDFMATFSKPGRHFSRVLANPRQFRGIVESVDQNSQTCLSSAAAPRITEYDKRG